MQADQLSFLQQISDELDSDAFEVMCKEESFLSPFYDGRRSELESVVCILILTGKFFNHITR